MPESMIRMTLPLKIGSSDLLLLPIRRVLGSQRTMRPALDYF